jgi:hypothetical protein
MKNIYVIFGYRKLREKKIERDLFFVELSFWLLFSSLYLSFPLNYLVLCSGKLRRYKRKVYPESTFHYANESSPLKKGFVIS